VTANQDRWNYMIEKLKMNSSIGHTALYNFPSISLSLKVKEELPSELKSWLNGDSYLLFQGAALKGRLFQEILSAVSGTADYKLVVLGPIEAETLNEIKLKYGATLDSILYVTGWVPQDDLYLYVDHALGSLVFYRNSSLNNWFCAPNRLYYSLARGVPVLCGNNPEMKAAIEGSGAGLVADTDGSDQIALERGLTMFLAGIEYFRRRAQASRDKFSWESQDNLIISALEFH
jgi:glycosyltransferase involved in cell wall biosynthesis